MKEKLFVYGTLGPGRPNAHILKAVGGTWDEGVIRGNLREEGWGAELGYPGLELDALGGEIDGFIFTSEKLAEHWQSLDEFEGEAYQRVLSKVTLKDGTIVEANVYILYSE